LAQAIFAKNPGANIFLAGLYGGKTWHIKSVEAATHWQKMQLEEF